MIEFSYLKHLIMYDRPSNKKGRTRGEKFDNAAGPFFGFSDDSGESEAHYNRFLKVRRSYLSPVVVMERVPGSHFFGGRVGKKTGNEVKLQRKLRKVSVVHVEEVENERSRTTPTLFDMSVGSQPAESGKKAVTKRGVCRRRKRPSWSGLRVTAQRINSQLDETLETKPALCSENAKNFDLDPMRDASMRSEEGSKRCTCHGEIECSGSNTDIHGSAQAIQSETLVEKNLSVRFSCYAKYEAQLKYMAGIDGSVKRQRLNNVDGSMKHELDEVEPEPMSIDSFPTCKKDTLYKCDVGSKDVGESVPLGPEEPVEAIGSSDQRPPLKCSVSIENELEYCHSLSPSSHPDKAILAVESSLLDADISLKADPEHVVDSTVRLPEKVVVEKEAGLSTNLEMLVEKRIEMGGLQSPAKPSDLPAIMVESRLPNLDDSQEREDTLRNVAREAVVEDIRTDQYNIPLEFNSEKEKESSVPAEFTEIHLDEQQAIGFRQFETHQVSPSGESNEAEKSIDEVSSSLWSSEGASDQRHWERTRNLTKSCYVRLERVPEIEKIVSMPSHMINYPVIRVPGHRLSVDLRKHRRSFPLQRKRIVRKRAPKKKIDQQFSTGDSSREGVAEIDLSDGLALKRFCQFRSINIVDSSSDEEKDAFEARDSSDWSQELTECVAPPSRYVPLDLPSSTRTLEELDPSVDSVVSENPVPSGVQALNELGFLEHESFQFEKDNPSESIWSDALDFGLSDTAALQSKYSDDDSISCVNSGKNTSVFGYVNGGKEFSEDKMESENMNSGSKEVVGCPHDDIFDSTSSGKDVDKSHLKGRGSTSVASVGKHKVTRGKTECGSEFLTSLIRPPKMPVEGTRKRGRQSIVDDERKRECHDGRLETGHGMAEDEISVKRKKRKSFKDSCDGEAQDVSPSKSKTVKTFPQKRKNIECDRENLTDEKVEAERALRELKYRLSTSWLTKRVPAKEENSDESVKDEGIESDAKEEVPTSEKLYSDLATIPYVFKCNLQNRCRKCKNLNPCANANKKFKLFFTLTVGVGRRLSKPLIDTLQHSEDSCKISRTAAFIAASAVASHPTTILVPAYPEVVQNLLPTYHSNLLMQLVAETEEMEKQEKKTHSEMAIAEALHFKRALIAMKTRCPTVEDPPQSMQSTPDPQSIILQSVRPGNPFAYKTNHIIGLKSKVDNKFRFVKKSLVSILPKGRSKGIDKPIEDEKKSIDLTEEQVIDSQEDGATDGSPPSKDGATDGSPPSKDGATDGSPPSKDGTSSGLMPDVPVDDTASCDQTAKPCGPRSLLPPNSSDCGKSKMNECSSLKSTPLSASNGENHNEPVEQKLKKGIVDGMEDVGGSESNNPDEIVPQIHKAFSLNDTPNHSSESSSTDGPSFGCTSHINGDPQKSEEPQNCGNRLCGDSLVCVSSNDPPRTLEAANKSSDIEPRLNETETHVTARSSHDTLLGVETFNTLESNCISESARSAQSVSDNDRCFESQLETTLTSTTVRENGKHGKWESSNSVQETIVLQDPSDSQPEREESPDVILVPDEFESIDLTTGDKESSDLKNDPFPKWAVVCSTVPELGFVKVKKIKDKLFIYDKAVVPRPFELHGMHEMGKFLNARLADLTFPRGKKIVLEWMLVTSGYLVLKTIPHTNALFWLPPYSAEKTLNDMRNFARRYGLTPIVNNSSEINSPPRCSLSKPQTTPNGRIKSAGSAMNMDTTSKLVPVSRPRFESIGKVVRINGQSVVMGSPANYTKQPKPTSYLPSPKVATVRSVVSSTYSAKSQAGSIPISSPPVSQYLMVSIPGSGKLDQKNRSVYTNSSAGYVPLVRIAASSPVDKTGLPSSTKSSLNIPQKQCTSLRVLPNTKPATSLSSGLLRTSQLALANSLVSSASRNPAASGVRICSSSQAPRMVTATVVAPSASSAARNQTPASHQAPILTQKTTICGPTSTSKLPEAGQGTEIRRPYKQLMVKPGYVKYVSLASIVPGSGSVGKTAHQSPAKTSDPTSESIKRVSGIQRVTVSPATHNGTVPCLSKPASATSTALSQELAKALSQQLGSHANNRSGPSKNRPILIIRNGSSGTFGKPNQVKFVFQNQ